MSYIREGVIKRIVVNRHKVAEDRKVGLPGRSEVISVFAQGKVWRGKRVQIWGYSEVKYSAKALRCGAHVWVETKAEVLVK